MGNFTCERAGPQNGARTQRVPLESSHVDKAPQLPASWKSTSSLQNNGVLYIGVWWFGPPADFGSSRYMRHSLPDAAISSRPLYVNSVGVLLGSRSRLRSHSQLDGVK